MTWSFLSNYGLVLLALARHPDLRIREIAQQVGVSPRAIQSIVTNLVEAGYLERRREGRRNSYRVRGDRAIGAAGTEDHSVADLIRALATGPGTGPPGGGRRHALVLGCSDHRFQEPMRALVAGLGLSSRAEIVLWPGGAASLTGPEGTLILEIMSLAVGAEPPHRVVLVAHEGCHVRGAFRSTGDMFGDAREVNRRRHRTVERVEETLGVRPELWYLSDRGASRVGMTGSDLNDASAAAGTPPGG